jgi:hypothetical protein
MPVFTRGPRTSDEGLEQLAFSGVPGGFLGELHPGGQAEFGVDVGEVGLHRAR